MNDMVAPYFVLAPMDGMTHASFRSICFDYGADGATTEMIQSLAYGRAKKPMSSSFEQVLRRNPNEKNLAAQLIGNDPAVMAKAARRLTRLGRFDAIDINMGCPARKVVGSGNGAALMRKPDKAVAVMCAVREATELPVRLKMRLGWDEKNITAPQLALEAERLGFQSIAIHGRTRMQMYSGEVNIESIRGVCEAVRIPVFANGSVTCAANALTFLQQTGAAGVSIGRAALKQPWIFDDIRRLRKGKPALTRLAPERISMLIRLAKLACADRPESVAICEMRKYCAWILQGFSGSDELMTSIKQITKLIDFTAALENYAQLLERSNNIMPNPDLISDVTLDTVCRP